ncbi:MAG: thymidine phosphorylase, partial [Lachnospiraceae bacterium]|nr:thymidine phosphorylase [Lachnospiraceae bacterium]
DKKIYALRDVTATVDNVSLIAASIMSKKLAAGADAIVLDVKVGSGAFMKTLDEARELARTMVAIGRLAGRKTIAVITDMNEPLGTSVGNILEVQEAIACLKGEGEARLMEVSKTLACHMLIAAGKARSIEEGSEWIEQAITSGNALAKMKEFVTAQGGDADSVEHPERLPRAAYKRTVTGEMLLRAAGQDIDRREAYLNTCDNQEVGMTSLLLGGGRQTKDSVIDLSVGIKIYKHLGDRITPADAIADLYANDEWKLDEATSRFVSAYTLSGERHFSNRVIYEVITE